MFLLISFSFKQRKADLICHVQDSLAALLITYLKAHTVALLGNSNGYGIFEATESFLQLLQSILFLHLLLIAC